MESGGVGTKREKGNQQVDGTCESSARPREIGFRKSTERNSDTQNRFRDWDEFRYGAIKVAPNNALSPWLW